MVAQGKTTSPRLPVWLRWVLSYLRQVEFQKHFSYGTSRVRWKKDVIFYWGLLVPKQFVVHRNLPVFCLCFLRISGLVVAVKTGNHIPYVGMAHSTCGNGKAQTVSASCFCSWMFLLFCQSERYADYDKWTQSNNSRQFCQTFYHDCNLHRDKINFW